INVTTTVVIGTKLINSSALTGFNILTPTFQPRSAIKPGKMIINARSNLTASIVANVGTSITPNIVVTSTTIVAVTVPYKHVSVEYLNTDHPLKRLPPIVYKTQPTTDAKSAIRGFN